MYWIIIRRVSDTDWIRIQEDQKMKNCMDHKVQYLHILSELGPTLPQASVSPRNQWGDTLACR